MSQNTIATFQLEIQKNPLTPESDQHLISPFNITPESHIKVMRIKEMIINWRILLIVKQILLASTLGNV